MQISRVPASGGAELSFTPIRQAPAPSADSGAPAPVPVNSNKAPAQAAPVRANENDVSPLDAAKFEHEVTYADSAQTEEFLQKLIEKVNDRLRGSGNREFNYSRHEKTGQFIVKILNRETKEVVREIPPEKTLDAVARMWDMMGIFVDNKT